MEQTTNKHAEGVPSVLINHFEVGITRVDYVRGIRNRVWTASGKHSCTFQADDGGNKYCPDGYTTLKAIHLI
tara:strand:+ start:170 stop:385 length:216 start_codon:yes stop_codon:yes gene_type:complete